MANRDRGSTRPSPSSSQPRRFATAAETSSLKPHGMNATTAQLSEILPKRFRGDLKAARVALDQLIEETTKQGRSAGYSVAVTRHRRRSRIRVSRSATLLGWTA